MEKFDDDICLLTLNLFNYLYDFDDDMLDCEFMRFYLDL